MQSKMTDFRHFGPWKCLSVILYVQEVVTLQKKYLIYLHQDTSFPPFINYIRYLRGNIIRLQSKIILGHMNSIGQNSSIQYSRSGHYFLDIPYHLYVRIFFLNFSFSTLNNFDRFSSSRCNQAASPGKTHVQFRIIDI